MSTEGTFITWLLGFLLHKAEYWPGMGFSVAVEQDQGGGALPSPLGWLLKHLPLPDTHSLWDNVFTSIPWAHFPFQLRSHPNVGIYLWQLKSSPCKHNLPKCRVGWDFSRVFIQPGMQGTEHRNAKEGTGAPPEPPAGNKRAFQRGI